MSRWLPRATALAVLGLTVGLSTPAQAELIFGLTRDGIVTFQSTTPTVVTPQLTLTGLQPMESLLGIDVRPATGVLYGLGSTGRLYTVNTTTGAATQVGTGTFSLGAGTAFGVDFDPVADRLRVVSNADLNMRLNPNTGGLAGIDAPLNPDFPNIVGIAYTNNFSGATATTPYAIDSNVKALFKMTNPNGGTLTFVGFLHAFTTDLVGFDISEVSGTAFASLGETPNPNVSIPSQLYTINLGTGEATFLANI